MRVRELMTGASRRSPLGLWPDPVQVRDVSTSTSEPQRCAGAEFDPSCWLHGLGIALRLKGAR